MSTTTQAAHYVASATASGREGRAVTSDGRIDVMLAPPREMGGSGEGTNPEQLFAAGYAASSPSALGLVARKRRCRGLRRRRHGRREPLGLVEHRFRPGRGPARRARRGHRPRSSAVSSSASPTRCAPTRTRRAATSRSRSTSTDETIQLPSFNPSAVPQGDPNDEPPRGAAPAPSHRLAHPRRLRPGRERTCRPDRRPGPRAQRGHVGRPLHARSDERRQVLCRAVRARRGHARGRRRRGHGVAVRRRRGGRPRAARARLA